jgi:hypothetical protein
MFGRMIMALFIWLPLAFVANLIGYYITLVSLNICLGCFLPYEIIHVLATLEFYLAILYTLLQISIMVLTPGKQHPVQP